MEALAQGHPALARWTVGARTGDTGSAERSAQSRQLPTVLVTTPESLSLLLARADARELLGSVRLVVADEWHELLGNKRGVQLQLALARLRGWSPQLSVWGMSATLGNLDEAMQTLLGLDDHGQPRPGVLVQGQVDKRLVVDTLLPDRPERFSWAGHLGLAMLPAVVRELEATAGSTLVFVNVRSQAELWSRLLVQTTALSVPALSPASVRGSSSHNRTASPARPIARPCPTRRTPASSSARCLSTLLGP